ncbi:MAG: protein jag [Lachnospiraceae bacterium]|nr:protein jag [Lachnospiraceae bacterium]
MSKYNFSAKTLADCITKACVELGVTSDMLDYTVVEQGSNGVLGIGARPWVISAGIREEEAPAVVEEAAEEKKAVPVSETVKKAEPEKAVEEVPAAPAIEAAPTEKGPVSVTEQEELCVNFLKNVFESMGLEVKIETSFDELLSELSVNLSGDDMGVLIGKRGQTLDSLQYLAGQVVNKHSGNYIRIKLDTENYRERRKETLETLAHNMAHKVRRTKKPMALEPMNPYERRIIHSSLQDEKDIFTRSEGEEPYRHVVVCYSKHKKQ